MTRGGTLCLPCRTCLPSVPVGVWPSFCVSLGEMPFDGTFLATRTSNGVRPGLVSKFLCHILPITLITFHSWTIRRPTLKHSLHPYYNLSLWSSSILSMSSHVSHPTRHCQDTLLQHSPCFSDPPFLALGLLRYRATLPSHIPRILSYDQHNGGCATCICSLARCTK